MKMITKKQLLLIAITCLTIGQMFSQGWRRTYDVSTQNEYAFTLMQTLDGGYLMEGDFHVKTDANGDQQWAVQNNHSGTFGNRHATMLNDGTYVVIEGSGVGDGVTLSKYDSFGSALWTQAFPLVALDPQEAHIASIDQTLDGGFIWMAIFLGGTVCNCNGYVLVKTDGDGNLIWQQNVEDIPEVEGYSVKSLSDGGYAIAGQKGEGLVRDAFIEKRDADGVRLWEKTWAISNIQQFTSIIESSDGDIVAAGHGNLGSSPATLIKLDQSGDEIWLRTWVQPDYFRIKDLKETSNGDFIMVGDVETDDGLIIRTDEEGNELWHKTFTNDLTEELFYSVLPTMDGGFAIAGVEEGKILLLKTDENGEVFTHHIHGKLFIDETGDCQYDGTEMGLTNWIVKAEGDQTFYGSTDADGNYDMLVDTGDYDVIITPFVYWESCQLSVPVSAGTIFDSTVVHIPVQPIETCPLMQIDVTVPFIRPCWGNILKVSYCNMGTALASDVTIEVDLAQELSLTSTSGNLVSQIGQTLFFDVGTVPVGACDDFIIYVQSDCNVGLVGQTLCTEARIFPDTTCVADQSFPNIEVSGLCENDSVKFEILNTGSSMTASFEYIVIEDNIILMQGDFQLDEGGIEIAEAEALSGSTYHLVAAQDVDLPDYFGHPVATYSLEGCVGTVDPGALNAIAVDDGEPWISINCTEVTASFDPNDKTPFPTGWTEEHYIEDRTNLEYLIRFQNTGTDTAFQVIIADTISAFLNPASIRLGSASHPYTFKLNGAGIATFTFDNILLPDSTTNEAESHGFVKFYIDQVPGNPIGTRIENTAYIYFDFNEAVQTNTVFHTIYEPWVELISTSVISYVSLTKVTVYPNPVFDRATIELDGWQGKGGQLEIYDTYGRAVLQKSFEGNTASFYRGDLPAGMYFFKMSEGNDLISTGQVLIR